MPGIVGIIGTETSGEKEASVQQMVKTMLHEPFYHSGTHTDRQLGVSVGWIAHAGSFADRMPVWNEAKDIALIFAGEHFGDASETSRLRGQGHCVEAADASHLVHLYEELGPDFFAKLNGWFSGVVLDLRHRRVVLFNDRFGLNRIYYHDTGDRFYFASEAKALLKVLPGLRKLNVAGLGEFFSCGCLLENKTLFTGVSLVPGGSAWTFAPGRPVQRASYFQPKDWQEQETVSAADGYEKLKDTFARVLPRYFRSGKPMGVSLTGGVDSRMMMAWAKAAPSALPCYTFGGMVRDSVDVKVARRVAAICGQQHQVIPVGREFLSEFPSLAARTVYLTDGAMDVSGSPDLYVNRLARQIAPVRLTGNYGGEILRSIVAFKPVSLQEGIFAPEFSDLVRKAASTYSSALDERRLSFVAFKQVPWHHYSRLSLELSQLTLRSPYLDNDLVALAFQMPAEAARSNEFSLRLISDGNRELGRIGTDRGLLYRSMPAVSSLKHWFQEFTFKAEYAYDYGMPHWLAQFDRRLSPLQLERLFLGRHKFYHFRLWYRRELSQFVKEVLLDSRTLGRPYFDARRIRDIVTAHVTGRGNYTLEIHRLLTSELLQRQLIEQN